MNFRAEYGPCFMSLVRPQNAELFVQLRPYFILPSLAACEQNRICLYTVLHPVICERGTVFIVRMSGDIHHNGVVRQIKKCLLKLDGLLGKDHSATQHETEKGVPDGHTTSQQSEELLEVHQME